MQQCTTADSIKLYTFIFVFVMLKDKYYFFNNTMHNSKIGYNFVKYFYKSILYVGHILDKTSKVILFKKKIDLTEII